MDLTDSLLIVGIGVLVYGLIIRPARQAKHQKADQVQPVTGAEPDSVDSTPGNLSLIHI